MLRVVQKEADWRLSWMLAAMLTLVTVLSARLAEYIPPTPIPLTFQVFAVLLSGLLLGRRWGAVAQIQYLLLGALNAPVFAKGAFGPGALLGLTGGYLLSYPLAAYVVGAIVEQGGKKDSKEGRGAALQFQALACAAGLAIIYGLGCAWFAAVAHRSVLQVLFQGALIFLAWDLVKAGAAIVVANGLQRRTRLGRNE